MILLDAVTKSLEVVLGAGVIAQLPIVANWADLNTSGIPTVSGVSDITLATNNTTAVTAVAAPLGSTTRQVKFLSVRNSNAAAVTVKVQINNNGTARVIVAASLSQDETLTYLDGVGISVLNWNGEHKESTILINLTSQVTGTLPVANGGTGDTTLAAHGVMLGNGTSAVTVLAPDASTTKVLTCGGVSADPTWASVSTDVSTATGTLPVNHGGTGAVTETNHGVLIGQGTSAIVATTVGATGTVLAGVTGADPAFRALAISDVPTLAATNQTTFASKNNSSNGSITMLGIAGAITPGKTGTIMITIAGYITAGSSSYTNGFQIYTGTGSAPTNGAAVTGTARGSQSSANQDIAGAVPFALVALVTGLTPATAYWIDIGATVNSAVTSTYNGCVVTVEIA